MDYEQLVCDVLSHTTNVLERLVAKCDDEDAQALYAQLTYVMEKLIKVHTELRESMNTLQGFGG